MSNPPSPPFLDHMLHMTPEEVIGVIESVKAEKRRGHEETGTGEAEVTIEYRALDSKGSSGMESRDLRSVQSWIARAKKTLPLLTWTIQSREISTGTWLQVSLRAASEIADKIREGK
jgi:hypothetical protein